MLKQCKQPYTFVSVVIDNESIKLHNATYHDGKNNNDKLTGLIQCTLTVKTPMIVGHFQYNAEELINAGSKGNITAVPKIIEKPSDYLVLPKGWEGAGYPQQDKKNNSQENYIVHKEKSILEPLFLDGTPESPVLISGTSLKGMIRQSLGAITNSPMERVEEKQFSYRPGIVYSNLRRKTNYKLLEAVALEDLQRKGTFRLEITTNGYQKKYTLNEDMVKRYWKTTETYDEGKKLIPKRRTHSGTNPYSISEGDIIFVEYDTRTNSILSFGNHEQYRWIYADTTTQIQDGTSGRHIPRLETHSPDNEILNASSGRLTAVRSLFGFVDGGKDAKGDDLKLGIGEDTYSRLAGRISINTAIEVLTNDTELTERFIQQKNNFNIPLKILSGPKASAYECYLDQSTSPESGLFNTYGDFIGFKESGTPLAGRKFYYRWQPDLKDYCLKPDNDDNCIALAGKQSNIARYISKQGRQFKFSIRFKDLSKEELGGLLVALAPQMAKDSENNKDYCQQIGHGRPLGLGSVKINIDQYKLLSDTNNQLELPEKSDLADYVKTFIKSPLCHKQSLENWLFICKPQNRPKSYLTVKDHGNNHQRHIQTVRNYHPRDPNPIRECYSKAES